VIVTVANLKGGVGKTTTSVFVAHALAEARGACALIDTDPQACVTEWAKRAAAAGRPLSVPVLTAPVSRLADLIPDAPNVVIDTPAADLDAAAGAIRLADLVLVPTSTSALDLSRVQLTVDAAANSGKPAAVLLTRTRRTRSVATSEESLRSAGVRVLRTHIPLREALAMSFGQPVRQLHGYELAIAELLGALPEQPYSLAAVRQRAGGASADDRTPPAPRLQPGPRQHSASPVRPRPRPWPIGPAEDEIVQQLKASMARLAITE
jgi:chromosome partitioning protein